MTCWMSFLKPSRNGRNGRKKNPDVTAVTAVPEFVLVGAAVASTSMTLTRTKVFLPLRFWVMKRNSWLGSLVTCWYCTSHWVAFAASWWLGFRGVEWFVRSMALVAISAIFVGLIIHAIKMLEPHPAPLEDEENE